MGIAYIGLGSNLNGPARQLRAALAALAAAPGLRLLAQSSLYGSAPMTVPGSTAAQAEYCNAVCKLEARQSPQELMPLLLQIERAAGRVRDGSKWAPRVLDLDLLHYVNDRVDVTLDEPGLTLPHPGIAQRNFVLWPLAELEPGLIIPGVGAVRERAQALGQAGLRRLDS